MNPHAYLMHGRGTVGPFCVESVPLRYAPHAPKRHAKRGPIASHWQVHFEGKWRRVIVSSNRNPFITFQREQIAVEFPAS